MKRILLSLCSLLLLASTALPQAFKSQSGGWSCQGSSGYTLGNFYYDGKTATSNVYSRVETSVGEGFNIVSADYCNGQVFYCATATTELVRAVVTKGTSATFSSTNNIKGTVVIPNGTVYLTVVGGTPTPMTKSGNTYTMDVYFGTTGKAFTITGDLPTASTIRGESGLTDANTGLPLTSGALTPASVQLNLTGFTSTYTSATITFNLLTNQVTQTQKTTPWISTSATSIEFGSATGISKTFSINSNTSWTISKPSWVNLSSTSGTGNATITATTNSENATGIPLTANITISATNCTPVNINITQAAGLQLSASTTSIELGQLANSSKTFNIASNVSWTISNCPSWLNLSATSGTGNATITATASSANTTSSALTATITLSATNCTPVNIDVTQISNNSLHFDGVDDYIELAAKGAEFPNILKNGFSFTTWIKRESTTGSECLLCLANDENQYSYRLMLDNSTGTLSFESSESTESFTTIATTSTNAISTNQWAHVAVTITTTGTAHIYVNGNDAATGNLGSPNTNGTRPFCYLGRWHISQTNGWATPQGTNYYHGAMDEASFWIKVLTQSEISASLANEFAGNETDLYFYYKFNQGTIAGANTAITTLDCNGGTHVATLRNFSLALNNTQSNFVAGYNAQNLYNLSATPTTATIDGNINSSASISITSNTTWTLTENADWLTPSVTLGTGNTNITLTCTKNSTSSARSTQVTLSATGAENVVINVTQNVFVPAVAVNNQAPQLAAAANSSATLSITSNADWTITGAPAWLSLNTTKGTRNTTLTITANTKNVAYSDRTATLTLSANENTSISTTITVTQAFEEPILNVTASSLEILCLGGNFSTLTLNSNTGWAITKPADCTWFSLNKTSGSNGITLIVTASSNNTGCDKRTGTFTISTTDITPAKTVTVSVSQQNTTHSLNVNQTQLTLSGNSNTTTSFNISSDISWEISKPSDCDWLTLGTTSGTGNATATVTSISRNTTGADRTASITITPSCANIQSRTVTITQQTFVPYINVYKNDILPSYVNGTTKIGFTSNTDWTVEESCDWFEVNKTSGTGDGEITLTATSTNSSKANRQGTLTLKSQGMSDQSYNIIQEYAYLNTSAPSPQQIGMDVGCTGQFSVFSSTQWTITNIPSWCTLSSTSGSGNGYIIITTTEANSTGAPRSANITLSGVGVDSKMVTIVQGYTNGTSSIDAGITSTSIYPDSNQPGKRQINATIKNFGTTLITGITVAYYVNNDYCEKSMQMGLESGASEEINLGNYPFFTPGDYNVKIVAVLPNDANPDNDALTKTITIQPQVVSAINSQWAINPKDIAPHEGLLENITSSIDKQGNTIVTGDFVGTVDFDLTATGVYNVTSVPYDESNSFIAKYNSNGELLFVKKIESTNSTTFKASTLDAEGNIFISGYFEGSVNFNLSNGVSVYKESQGHNSAYFAKYSPNGELIFVKTIPTTRESSAEAIAIDGNNNICISGSFSGIANFNINSDESFEMQADKTNSFVAKYSGTGELIFAKNIQCTDISITRSISLDSENSIYVGGEFSNDLYPNPADESIKFTSNGSSDIFIAKYSSTGDYVYAKAFGGTDEDGVSQIAINSSKELLATGHFRNTIDFNSDAADGKLTSAGNTDIYVAKFGVNGEYMFAKGFGSINYDFGISLVLDTDENIYVGGSIDNTVDFNPDAEGGEVSETNSDAFIAKFAPDGNYIFAKSTGGYINSLALSGNRLLASGKFYKTEDFDPSDAVQSLTPASGNGSGFIAKYSTSACDYAWVGELGGYSNNELTQQGHCIKADAQGNTYITGQFTGSVDFDPSANSVTLTAPTDLTSMFIAKYDNSGALVWAKGIISNDNISATLHTFDKDGNIVVTGTFKGTAYFNPADNSTSLTSSLAGDAFVAKYDANGNYISAYNLGSNKSITSLTVDSDNSVYLAGYFIGTVDFDPSTADYNLTSTNGNAFFAKYNADGSLAFAKALTSNNMSYGRGIATDEDHNIYVAGYFTGTTSFDPNSTAGNLTSEKNSSFFAKYSASGDYVFAKSVENTGSGENYTFSMVMDKASNFYITGVYSGTADFDMGSAQNLQTAAETSSMFVARYDASGNYIYAKSLHGITGNGIPSSMAVDESQNIYLAGLFSGTIDFDPSEAGVAIRNADMYSSDVTVYSNFIARYDALGNYLDANSFGNSESIVVTSLATDPNGNIYTTGYFDDKQNFGSNEKPIILQSENEFDIFVAKFIQQPEINVMGNGVDIISGSTATSTTDNTDFGSANIGTVISKTFTIESKGLGNLTATQTPVVTVTGDGFTVSSDAPSVVKSGNSATFEVSYTASCGTSTGTVTIHTNDEDEGTYIFAIQGSGIDNIAPIADVATLPEINGECSATVVTIPTATDGCSGAVQATTESPLSYTEQGTYTVVWKYTDAAGNFATQNQTVVVKDITAPVVVCVENQTRTIPASENSYIATGTEFNLVSSSDNCTIASITNDFNNQSTLAGAVFPVGTTNVNWAVTDIAGNSTSCSFTVIVNKASGVSEIENKISIYPNPVHTQLNINCESNIKTIKIFNINGQLAITNTFSSSHVVLDLQSLKVGVYFIEIETLKGKFTQKLIKQ